MNNQGQNQERQLQTINKSGEVAVFNFFNPEQFQTMQRVCKMFANSELVPDMYKATENNPLDKAMANCMIAIDIAQRIGASPLMIMQNMAPIYGKPSWSSKFLIATVNTCGRFNPLQFKFTNLGKLGKVNYTEYDKEWIKGTNGAKGYYKKTAKVVEFDGLKIDNLQCIAFTTAKGSKDILESSPVDIMMAVQEGWYTKSGSKWVTMTQQMLMYRAASFWTNTHAPEISMGMKTEEEMRDIVDVTYEEVKDNDSEKLKEDISAQANKTTINMDNAGSDNANKPPQDNNDGANIQETTKKPDQTNNKATQQTSQENEIPPMFN